MIKRRYLSCIQTHTWGTYLISAGANGEIIYLDNESVTIRVQNKFLYNMPHSHKMKKWSINVKACLYYEHNIEPSYYDKYESLCQADRTCVDQLYFKLVKSDIEDSVFIDKIKNEIDERLMDQALS